LLFGLWPSGFAHRRLPSLMSARGKIACLTAALIASLVAASHGVAMPAASVEEAPAVATLSPGAAPVANAGTSTLELPQAPLPVRMAPRDRIFATRVPVPFCVTREGARRLHDDAHCSRASLRIPRMNDDPPRR